MKRLHYITKFGVFSILRKYISRDHTIFKEEEHYIYHYINSTQQMEIIILKIYNHFTKLDLQVNTNKMQKYVLLGTANICRYFLSADF